jgi:TonB family protein
MECDIDKQGNGNGKETLAKVRITGTGAMKGGKQTGNWTYVDSSGKKVMEVLYNDNGIEKETCFDKEGKPITNGQCISDRRPEFPGGESAWLQFLQKNLTYPKDLRKAQVQGVVKVKFLIKEDGSLSGFKVLESPDPELSSEALRVLRLSPKWNPSIEYNKPVPFTHIQAITFQLK